MSITITEAEKNELEELYTEAEGQFLQKMDFSIIDWLDDDQIARFRELYKKDNGFCYDSTCGDRVNCDNCKA